MRGGANGHGESPRASPFVAVAGQIRLPDVNQAVRLAKAQWSEQHGIGDAKDRRVRSDPESQGQGDDGCKSRVLANIRNAY
jgi:hypothetical protein